MTELIHRMKNLNRDARNYHKANKSLEEKYGFLRRVMPLSEKLQIKEPIYFIDVGVIYKTLQFKYIPDGQIGVQCFGINTSSGDTVYKNFDYDLMKHMIPLTLKEVDEKLDRMIQGVNFMLSRKVALFVKGEDIVPPTKPKEEPKNVTEQGIPGTKTGTVEGEEKQRTNS